MADSEKNGPFLMDYQLIGGTISVMLWHALRVRENPCSLYRLPMRTENCHSYWRVEDIATHLGYVKPSYISDRVILSVGYQDSRNTRFLIDHFKWNFELIVNILRSKGCQQMIVTNVPPCAAAARTYLHWYVLQEINDAIWEFCCQNDDLIFCDIFHLFCNLIDDRQNGRYITGNSLNYEVNLELYNMWSSHNTSKKDLISFSDLGKKKLLKYLKEVVISQKNAIWFNLERPKGGTSIPGLEERPMEEKAVKIDLTMEEGTYSVEIEKTPIKKEVIEIDSSHDKEPIVVDSLESKMMSSSSSPTVDVLKKRAEQEGASFKVPSLPNKVPKLEVDSLESRMMSSSSSPTVNVLKKRADQEGTLFKVPSLPNKVPKLEVDSLESRMMSSSSSPTVNVLKKRADQEGTLFKVPSLPNKVPKMEVDSLESKMMSSSSSPTVDVLKKRADQEGASFKVPFLPDKVPKLDQYLSGHNGETVFNKLLSRDPRLIFPSLCLRSNRVVDLKPLTYSQKSHTRDAEEKTDITSPLIDLTTDNAQGKSGYSKDSSYEMENDVPSIDTTYDFEDSIQHKIDEFANPDLTTELSKYEPNTLASELAKLGSTTLVDFTFPDHDMEQRNRHKREFRKSLKRLLGRGEEKRQKRERRNVYKDPNFLAHDFYCNCEMCQIGHWQLLNKTKKLIKLLQREAESTQLYTSGMSS